MLKLVGDLNRQQTRAVFDDLPEGVGVTDKSRGLQIGVPTYTQGCAGNLLVIDRNNWVLTGFPWGFMRVLLQISGNPLETVRARALTGL